MPEEIFKKQAKEASGGAGYVPFTLSAARYNNSPIQKNFGSPAKRGITTEIESNNPEAVSQRTGVLYSSSPAKGWLSGITKAVGGWMRKRGITTEKGKPGQTQMPTGEQPPEEPTPQEAAVEAAAGGGGVQPHGDEAHTGGGGGGGGNAFEAMGIDEFRGMGKGDRRQYMRGLSKEDRRTQLMSNLKGMGLGGIQPPKPGGMWGGIGASVRGVTSLFSDKRLKENIEKVGNSESGIPIYEFNYIGDENRYSGAMAQDLIDMGVDAVSTHESGYYMVDYNSIDINMETI